MIVEGTLIIIRSINQMLCYCLWYMWYMMHGIWYMVYALSYMLDDVRSLHIIQYYSVLYGTLYFVHFIRNYEVRYMVYGKWYVVSGTW